MAGVYIGALLHRRDYLLHGACLNGAPQQLIHAMISYHGTVKGFMHFREINDCCRNMSELGMSFTNVVV